MKVYVAALGCKLNESELEAWTREFVARGETIVRDAAEADLIVVNSCTVTAQAARKSRSLVRQLGKRNSGARIVLTGCYAARAPEEARNLPNVTLVVPNQDKDSLVRITYDHLRQAGDELVASGCRMPEAASGELPTDQPKVARQSATEPTSRDLDTAACEPAHLRTRAFVKIEDGCNLSCSYCIIPLARGRARSRPAEDIVKEIKLLASNGYKEVILTGVQISDYRLEARRANRGRLWGLIDLVQRILSETDLARLRLTSIAPWDLEPDFLELFNDRRLCRHLHLSLQSGSDSVLERMRRPYTALEFARKVELARSFISDLAISTDVIVGFPGETDKEFQESLDFVEQIQFARVHVFPYSARTGTAAAALPRQVSDTVKEHRAKLMQEVADASLARFASRFVGKVLHVLYEDQPDGACEWAGYSDNYIRVVAASPAPLANQIVPTLLVGQVPGGALGRIVTSASCTEIEKVVG